ncbi:hypothetical protein SB01124_04435 [Klebsiella quasipneumoniae subsp. quasipneumoniae]|nr:hypothetical protein SB01124_04435 [Klebsiella quasipneumoniae subsp. quasipneumoniae]
MTQATHSASTPNRRTTIFGNDAAAAISSPKAWKCNTSTVQAQ